MSVKITGFDSLERTLSGIEGGLSPEVKKRSRQLANQLAGVARAGAPSKEGRLRSSIRAFSEESGEAITAGAKTDYPPAWYHEFGTGPVGEEHNHPAAEELGITHKGEGWTYYSEEAVGQPLSDTIHFGPHKGENRTPPGQIGNGFVYTEGVPARAFMYNAMKSMEDEIMDELGAALTEVLRK